MLTGDERDVLGRLSSVTRAQDPLFVEGLCSRRPRPPREYRAARLRRLSFGVVAGALMIMAVELNAHPAVVGSLMLATLACGLIPVIAYPPGNLDRPERRRPPYTGTESRTLETTMSEIAANRDLWGWKGCREQLS
jgi:hypothetical protein